LSESGEAGLSGNLRLVCKSSPERGTFLAEQSFSAPIHLSKSYWDGETLLVHLVNQTAGIFGGDSIRTHITVESGARVLLSSPSAARFHPSRGRESRLEQVFEVQTGGSLDLFPEISIPQRDSRSRQKTAIRLEPGAELIYLETLTPGRVASGEVFAFESYAWSTDISVGPRAVLRERASLSPQNASIAGLQALFPVSYYASIVVIPAQMDPFSADFAHDAAKLGTKSSVIIAASKLNAHGWSVRILAADGIGLQEGIRAARALIYERLGRKQPEARRNGL
jgi:urease accessory protein